MNNPVYYTYDEETKFYTGTVICSLDPENKGKFFLPGTKFYTDKILKEITEEWTRNWWNGEDWEIKPYHFNQKIWNKQTKEMTYCQTVFIPEDYTELKPETEFDEWKIDKWITNVEKQIGAKWIIIRAKRNNLLFQTDWTQIIDNKLSSTEKDNYKIYRQKLRDIPETFNNPDEVEWPEV